MLGVDGALLTCIDSGVVHRLHDASRLITGCLGSSRIQSLLLEAGLLPLEGHFQYQCTVTTEKCRRLPLPDPLQRRGAFTYQEEGPRVFSWREKAEALYKENKIQLYQNEENSAVAFKIGCRKMSLIFSEVPLSEVDRVIF